MRTLPPPTIPVGDILNDCLTATVDANLHARLTGIAPDLEAAAALFDVNAKARSLHTLPRVVSVGTVTKDELKALYSKHMSSANGSARSAYDSLRNAAPNKRCPLCGVGTVATLDHHLPKSKYPDLSILPGNLVPACHYCNDAKRARFPKTAAEQTIHPYYDDYSQQQWVYADIIAGPPLALSYRVTPPGNWALTDRMRVLRHFTVCKLGTLFTSNANDDLITLRQQLVELHSTAGTPGVVAHLQGEAGRYSLRLNSWQHAMYQSLAASNWFVSGGFRQIAN